MVQIAELMDTKNTVVQNGAMTTAATALLAADTTTNTCRSTSLPLSSRWHHLRYR